MALIQPTWSLPSNVMAYTTNREGGVSLPPFDGFNLGAHVGDNPQYVQQNRERLVYLANLPHFPLFLNQTHSTRVVRLPYFENNLEADAVYTNQPHQVCLVMTADCLPVLFVSQDGKEIAAAHAGWKGLCNGILEATVAEFACPKAQISVWLGPAIGEKAFQVGQDVVDQFCVKDEEAIAAFRPDLTAYGKYFGNLYQIAKQRLNKLGIVQINGGEYCTYTQAEQFFSYRRDGKTGRMATFIWRTQ